MLSDLLNANSIFRQKKEKKTQSIRTWKLILHFGDETSRQMASRYFAFGDSYQDLI